MTKDKDDPTFAITSTDSTPGTRIDTPHSVLRTVPELLLLAEALHLTHDFTLTIVERRSVTQGNEDMFAFESPEWQKILAWPTSQFDLLVHALDCDHLQQLIDQLYGLLNDRRRDLGEPPRVRPPRPTHPSTETPQ